MVIIILGKIKIGYLHDLLNSCSEALPADYGYFGCVLFRDTRANDVLDSIIFYSKESLDSIIFYSMESFIYIDKDLCCFLC